MFQVWSYEVCVALAPLFIMLWLHFLATAHLALGIWKVPHSIDPGVSSSLTFQQLTTFFKYGGFPKLEVPFWGPPY